MTIARTVRPRFNWFTAWMWRKLALPQNQAKDDWRELSRDRLLGNLLREVAELVETDPDDVPAVTKESADVANTALMIADHARHHGGA